MGKVDVSALCVSARNVLHRCAVSLNFVLFILTLWTFIWLAVFPQVNLCPGVKAGAAAIGVLAVGGHFVLTVVWTLKSAGYPLSCRRNAKAGDSSAQDQVEKAGTIKGDFLDNPMHGSTTNQLDEETSSTEKSGARESRGRPACSLLCVGKTATLCIVAVAVIALYAFGIIGMWLQDSTAARLQTSLRFPGLSSETTIVHDARGYTKIAAGNEHDLWFGQGVAHAQTRLWQMEFQRRVGSGRLAEAVGKGGLSADKLFRTLGTAQAAERDLAQIPIGSPQRKALEAYTEGVNAYMQEVMSPTAGGSKYLPLEFRILGYVPDPWKPVDSLVWAKVMAFDLGGNYRKEATRAAMMFYQGMSAARIDTVNPPYDVTRFPTILNMSTSAVSYSTVGGAVHSFPTLPAQAEAELRAVMQRATARRLQGVHQPEEASATEAGPQAASDAQPHSDTVGQSHTEEEGQKEQEGEQPATAAIQDCLEAAEKAVQDRLTELQARDSSASYVDEEDDPLHLFRFSPFPVRATAWAVAGLQRVGDVVLRLRDRLAGTGMEGPSTPCASSGAPSKGRRLGASLSSRRSFVGTFRSTDDDTGPSNNWVVHGMHTASGKPLVANDPHLSLLAPSIWYLTHLSCPSCGIEVIGAGFAGVPCVTIGRNRKIAWAVTNAGVDVQDLYVMVDHPTDKDKYWMDDGAGYRPYTTRTEVIKVKGEADVTIKVRTSRFGPVITDNGVFEAGSLLSGRANEAGLAPLPSMSLRWTAIDPSINFTLYESLYRLQTSSNWAQFRTALTYWTAPAQNFVYADMEGNIGYQVPGWLPVRNLTAGHTGAFPAPGTSTAYDWQGSIPFDELPRAYNPPTGYIVTGNNHITPPRVQPVGVDPDSGSDGYRAQRMEQMIRQRGPDARPPRKLTVQDMADIQFDTVSLFARDVAGLLASIPDSLFTGPGLALRKALSSPSWDYDMRVGSRVATLFGELQTRLYTLVAKETGQTHWRNAVFILNMLASDASPSGTEPACTAAGFSSCAHYVAKTVSDVAEAYGIKPDGAGIDKVPAWGTDVHRLQVKHGILHGSLLTCLASRVTPHGGDPYTPNVGGFALTRSKDDAGLFTQTHGPSYRHVVDLSGDGSDSKSLFVHPMGQDGAQFSQTHAYDTLLYAWTAGVHISMSMEGAGGKKTVMRP